MPYLSALGLNYGADLKTFSELNILFNGLESAVSSGNFSPIFYAIDEVCVKLSNSFGTEESLEDYRNLKHLIGLCRLINERTGISLSIKKETTIRIASDKHIILGSH